ncbi:MAG: hypothetical protein RL291_33 [Pseudomonadota bacterium]|jgi:hypothetical protein
MGGGMLTSKFWAPCGAMFTALLVAACSSATVEPDAPVRLSGCLDDSKQCVDQRQAQLKALQADRSRQWVRQQPTVEHYAGGVRLFAFKTERTRMTCQELAVGQREADAAPTVLRGPQGRGLSPAQISRGVMFAAEVGNDLRKEMGRRCRV